MKNDPCSCELNLCNCERSLKKNQDFNGVWTCECVVLVQCSNQLSYEATDVGSWSVMCSYVPVKEMNVTDVYEINHISTAEMESSEEWSLQLWMQFMQLRKKPEKKNQDFNGVWAYHLTMPVWCYCWDCYFHFEGWLQTWARQWGLVLLYFEFKIFLLFPSLNFGYKLSDNHKSKKWRRTWYSYTINYIETHTYSAL